LVDFVDRAVQEGGPQYVPPSERIAVFDNDGTLWCEKPMPPELGFVLQRLAEMAEEDPSLRTRQPWQAAWEKDYAWLGNVITKHYHGDDSDVKVLLGGIMQAFATVSVDTYANLAERFLRTTPHPTLERRLRDCAYLPMVELLHYLEANGFTTYIASGGDRDFMRPITSEIYGIPAERVIGSSAGLRYQEDDSGGSLIYQAEMDVLDDGPMKPVRIWSRTGRRPVIAGGNSNGDIPMLQYAGHPARPGLRLLVLHDDEEREFSYTAGAETSLERARAQDWTVVSVKNDWATVFAKV
jgi:phosphoserine phosphatase